MTQSSDNEREPEQTPGAPNPLPDRFKPVIEPASTQGAARDPAGAKAGKTGRTELNVESSNHLDDEAREKFGGIDQCGIVWAADDASGDVAGYLVSTGTPGLTPIRRDTNGTLVVYLNSVFKKHGKLRPKVEQWCSFTAEPGGYFVIHLGIPLDRVKPSRVKRKSDKADQAPKPVDTQQPAEDDDSEETA